MKSTLIYTALAVIAGLIFSYNAKADTVSETLKTINYNFALGGDGGGAKATLNGLSVEVFCDDFANLIQVPQTYTANVTTLSPTADLSSTRFGQVTSWTGINLTGSGSTVIQDETFFNTGTGFTAVARYEMVAYLVSLYKLPSGGNAANNRIQDAIWTLMDPSGGASFTPTLDPTADLELAASWYATMNLPANEVQLNTFLGSFEIVSDPGMIYRNGRGIHGFQEQIVETPEPRAEVLLLCGLLVAGGIFVRRWRSKLFADHTAS